MNTTKKLQALMNEGKLSMNVKMRLDVTMDSLDEIINTVTMNSPMIKTAKENKVDTKRVLDAMDDLRKVRKAFSDFYDNMTSL